MSRNSERPDRNARDEKPASGDRGNRTPAPPPQKNRRQAFTWLTLLALVVLLWVVMTGTSRGMRKIETFQQFSTYLKEDKVKPGSVVSEGRVRVGAAMIAAQSINSADRFRAVAAYAKLGFHAVTSFAALARASTRTSISSRQITSVTHSNMWFSRWA